VGDHPIAVVVLPALASVLVGEVSPEVHGRRVVPEEERLVCFCLLLHKAESACCDLLVDGLHALLSQRAGVLNRLLAYSAPAGIRGCVILIRRKTVHHSSGPKSG